MSNYEERTRYPGSSNPDTEADRQQMYALRLAMTNRIIGVFRDIRNANETLDYVVTCCKSLPETIKYLKGPGIKDQYSMRIRRQNVNVAINGGFNAYLNLAQKEGEEK